MPTYKYKDVIRLLLSNGFVERTGKGSHFVYEHEFFNWLSVAVDAGHKEISANVYMCVIRAIALKRFILQEHYDSKERRKLGLCEDVEGKLEKGTVLELFSEENRQRLKLEDKQTAQKFIENERAKYKRYMQDKEKEGNYGKKQN